MKCPRCRHANRHGARFCDDCGASLSMPAAALGPPRDARAYTPRHLVDKILTSRGALEGERKQVTVLFADVADSMRLAEALDPEDWHGILERIFEILARSVHRFEGTVNQFTGDGVMALFGAPVAHEDHARRACHAALAAMEDLRAYAGALHARGLPLALRMGLNSGEVVVGKIGDDLRMDYTAQGHCVGLAARAQAAAAPGTALVTEHTARMIEGFFALADRGVQNMKGVSAPVRVFELVRVGPLRTRLDASRVRGFSRLIGREAELAWLDSILSRVIEANGQIVGLVGDAGVGKSRLCLEFVQRCRARGVAVYEAHCPTHGATVPWLTIHELLRSYFALSGGEDAEAIRRSVERRLLALDQTLADAVPVVLEALGVADAVAPGLGSQGLMVRFAGFLRDLVRLESARGPVVFLLDDAHWIDPPSDELGREIATSVRDTRTLLLANFRPEYRPPWIGGSRYHQLALAPLGEADSRELLLELLGADDSLGALADQIREHTGGNPFFTEEVVQALAASGSLVGAQGAYRLGAPIDDLALPATVQSLLAARIDRLGERAKPVLEMAAVIGHEFDEALLGEVSGLGHDDLDAALAELQEEDLLRRLGPASRPEYAFKHPLVREVAYRSQLNERRARLHAVVATALERLRADRLGQYASLIAHHWGASGMRFEEVRWKRRAALQVANIKVRGHGRRPAR